MVTMIQFRIEKKEYEMDTPDDVNAIGRLISSCYGEYLSQHSEPMLVDPKYLDYDRNIVEHAINLAGQVLVSSLHSRHISHATYWPTQPLLVKRYARLIRDMIMIHPLREHEPAQSPRRLGYPFWAFRDLAIQSAFPSVVVVTSTDLAYAADGYVAYTNVLITGGAMEDDAAAMAQIHVVPGLLKWEEAESQYAQGRYVRVTQDPQRMNSKASRTVSNTIKGVRMLDGDEYLGVSEQDARNDLDITIKHLIRRDERQKTLFLTTLLQETPKQSVGRLLVPAGVLELNIPTHWQRSIDVAIFAERIRQNTSSLRQLESLARDWAKKGYLNEGLQWCPVGQLTRDGRRYITKTSTAAQLRFFEAGNVSEGRRVFIRQHKVPLGHCVKVAMDLCEDGADWAIIS
jgi:hypothetical protein